MSTQSSPITSARTMITATLLPMATATVLVLEAFEDCAAADVGVGNTPDGGSLPSATVGAGPLTTVTEGIWTEVGALDVADAAARTDAK